VGFEPPAIRLREGPGDHDWTTLDDLHWIGEFRHKTVHLLVPQPFITDLASVPRVLTWLIPRYGRYTKAAVLHDYYCRHFRDEQVDLLPTPAQVISGAADKEERTTVELRDRSDADELFRWTMRELGVGPTTRTYMWAAVSFGTLAACLREGRGTKPVLRWTGVALLALFVLAGAGLLFLGAGTAILDAGFAWRWVRILVFAVVVWAWGVLGFVAAGYVAQGRWDRGPAYLGAVVLAVPAVVLAVPLATVLVFLLVVWVAMRDRPPPGGPAPGSSVARQRRVEAVQAS
jgi:hypothetical protein